MKYEICIKKNSAVETMIFRYFCLTICNLNIIECLGPEANLNSIMGTRLHFPKIPSFLEHLKKGLLKLRKILKTLKNHITVEEVALVLFQSTMNTHPGGVRGVKRSGKMGPDW